MLFTVTYRSKSGAKAEVEIEAASRAACVAECKRRGIAPTGIREGRASSRPRVARSAAPHDGGASSGGIWKAAILAAICLAAGTGAWWWLGRDDTPSSQLQDEKPKPKPKPVSSILKGARAPQPEEISHPTNASAAKASEPVPAPPPATNEPPRKLTMAERGIRVVKPRKPLHKSRFKYLSEEHIAVLIETEPGTTVFGEIPYGKKFIEDFKASLLEDVKITPEDGEYERQLKKAVQETKNDLKARMEAGEDIAQIMRDARKQLIELGNYRSSLEEELKQIARGGEFTEDEFGKFVKAANQMLEAKGATPIKPTRMMYKMLELKAKRNARK